ncbi:MAG: C40 family peptidase [Treponema sp.]|jgi:hypothetical protein|nr:C40 family peptidase [Treponema sp.]
MRFLFSVILIFSAFGLFAAAPLEGGYSLAPRSSASPEEKARAYQEARGRVIRAAAKYENVPYQYGGMTTSGLDCSGFICLSFKDALGVSLPRSAAGLHSWTEKIPLANAQPGDLLFFRTDRTGNITHVALYLGSRRFIHAASAGLKTGVIYNTLDEGSWSHNFAGAGRVFPEVIAGYQPVLAGTNTPPLLIGDPSSSSGSWGGSLPDIASEPSFSTGDGRLLLGAAFAPTWVGFLKDASIVRGFASQLRLGADTYSLGKRMIFGLEVRPEYDGALGVFRLPITLSWGPNDQIRIFAGPVFSFGDAVLSTEDGERYYSGGTSWLGTIGLTAAPFIFETKSGEWAPYIEAAWQSYFSDNSKGDAASDFSAGFRFSTGIRWTIPVKISN